MCWITIRSFLVWVLVRDRWNILVKVNGPLWFDVVLVVNSINMSQSQGLSYYFVDYVIKGYTGQDHIQVVSVVHKLNQLLKKKTPPWTKCSSIVIMQHAFTPKSLSHFNSTIRKYILNLKPSDGLFYQIKNCLRHILYTFIICEHVHEVICRKQQWCWRGVGHIKGIMVSGWDYRYNGSDTVCSTVSVDHKLQYIQIKKFSWSTHEIKLI